MNFNPFPAIPRIARGQGISNLRGVYTVKHGAQRSHSEACSLKKCTLPYIYFVFKCLVLYCGIKKEWLEKKFEYFFIGSEHP